MSTKNCYKGYLNDGEMGFAGEATPPNFRKRGTYEVGDAVVWDTRWEMFRVVPPENIELLDKTVYIPTGVIAIPSSHNVYGTREAGVVALLSASSTTPNTGQITNSKIYWGADYTDSGLTDYNLVPVVKRNGNIVTNELYTFVSNGYLPSDKFSSENETVKAIDGTYYYWDSTAGASFIPSPYLADGSRNSIYYQTEPSASTTNMLSDFAGKSNTEFLCSKSTAQADWRTANSITDKNVTGYYPAACCCWRYYTSGTSQGDWYLPACGELGYIFVRQNKINETIVALQDYFNIELCQFYDSAETEYVSSTELSQNSICSIRFNTGLVWSTGKHLRNYTRPFTRLK